MVLFPGRHHLYVLRHGRTALNAAGALRGRVDVPLDDTGREEAQRLARLFTEVPLALVVSSPLTRAWDTAAAVANASGAPVVVEPGFLDRDYGAANGESREEAIDRYGSLELIPGVEPRGRFERRILDATAALLKIANGRPVAIVAHDVVNRALLEQLVPALAASPEFPQPTGCWNELVCHDGTWTGVAIGALPGDGRTPGADEAEQSA